MIQFQDRAFLTGREVVKNNVLRTLGRDLATISKSKCDIETCLYISRIHEEFGYVPEYDLEKGLTALAAYLRDGSYL